MSQQVAKVQDAAQSYTKADGEIVRLMLQKPALLLPKKCYMISALIKVSQQTVGLPMHGTVPIH